MRTLGFLAGTQLWNAAVESDSVICSRHLQHHLEHGAGLKREGVGRQTVIFELYMTKGAVCVEDVVARVEIERRYVEFNSFTQLVLLETFVCFGLELFGFSHLHNRQHVTYVMRGRSHTTFGPAA